MRVLFSTSGFGTNKNTSFMPLVASELHDRGHDVQGIQYEPGDTIDRFPITRIPIPADISTPWWTGNWMTYKFWRNRVKKYLADNNPDVIVSDRVCMIPTIQAADSQDVPVVGVIPGLGFTRFAPYDLGHHKSANLLNLPWSARIQYPFVKSLFRQHKQYLPKANEVIVISEFLRKTIQETFHVKSTVIPPPVPFDEVTAQDSNGGCITAVNLRSSLKGADIFLRVAERLPNEHFLLAGGLPSRETEQRAQQLGNLDYLGWVDEMERVYERTKLLLVPSRVEEGGPPRVTAEAFGNGIPVVGSNRGAIPEFIDNAGEIVQNIEDILEWESKIETILTNYDQYSANAMDRTTIFEVGRRIDEIEAVLEAVNT